MPAYKRKVKRGERWRYAGSYLAKPYCSKSIYLTKKEAQDAEREYIRQMDEEARRPKREVMLIDFLNARLDYLQGKSKKYYKESHRYLKMLLAEVGDKPVDQVTKLEINKFIQSFSDNLMSRKKTQHKANAMLRILKSAFAYGINLYDLEIRNPCTGLKMKSIDKKFKYIPSDKEIEAVMALCDDEEQLLIRFVMDTGARIQEALNFARQDLFDNYLVLYTRKSVNSNRVGRKLPIPDCIKELDFKGNLFKRWTHQPHFLGKRARKLKQTSWAWHNLRHRFASLEVKKGTHIYIISQLLGHSSITTTEIYLQQLQ